MRCRMRQAGGRRQSSLLFVTSRQQPLLPLHDLSTFSASWRLWGFVCNFGSLLLMAKLAHLLIHGQLKMLNLYLAPLCAWSSRTGRSLIGRWEPFERFVARLASADSTNESKRDPRRNFPFFPRPAPQVPLESLICTARPCNTQQIYILKSDKFNTKLTTLFGERKDKIWAVILWQNFLIFFPAGNSAIRKLIFPSYYTKQKASFFDFLLRENNFEQELNFFLFASYLRPYVFYRVQRTGK
jgi:hypothetical protein